MEKMVGPGKEWKTKYFMFGLMPQLLTSHRRSTGQLAKSLQTTGKVGG